MPTSRFSSVVLPPPLRPTTQVSSPALISKQRSEKIRRGPPPRGLSNSTVTWSIRKAGRSAAVVPPGAALALCRVLTALSSFRHRWSPADHALLDRAHDGVEKRRYCDDHDDHRVGSSDPELVRVLQHQVTQTLAGREQFGRRDTVEREDESHAQAGKDRRQRGRQGDLPEDLPLAGTECGRKGHDFGVRALRACAGAHE